MPTKNNGAGSLRYLLEFQKRTDGDDGYGGAIPGTGPFATVFTASASLTPLRGSEPVMADRLQGVRPYVCRIRNSNAARAITTAWQVVDRNGTIYQVKEPPADPDGKRAWLEFIVSVGSAA